MKISTVLGDSREATRTYADGSFDCPYCSYAVIAPATTCSNPWCEAHPAWAQDSLAAYRQKIEAERKRKEDDERRRSSVAEAARQRYLDHEEWLRQQYALARERGACLNCLIASGWERAKFIVHRNACPKTK